MKVNKKIQVFMLIAVLCPLYASGGEAKFSLSGHVSADEMHSYEYDMWREAQKGFVVTAGEQVGTKTVNYIEWALYKLYHRWFPSAEQKAQRRIDKLNARLHIATLIAGEKDLSGKVDEKEKAAKQWEAEKAERYRLAEQQKDDEIKRKIQKKAGEENTEYNYG